jgi:hypothetical protein
MSTAWPTITAELGTRWHDRPVSVQATTGRLARVIAGKDVRVDVEARVDQLRARLSGTVADLRQPTKTPLQAELSAPSLAELGPLVDIQGLPALPLTAYGLVAIADGSVMVEHLTARAGESDVSGTVRVTHQGRMHVAADLTSSLIDVTPWQSTAEQKLKAEQPSGASQAAASEGLLEQPFPVAPLRSFDATARLRAAQVVGPRYRLTELDANVRLQQGVLDLLAAVAEGDAHLELRVDASGSVPAVAMRTAIKDLDLGSVAVRDRETFPPDLPRVSLRTELSGAGATPAALRSATQGEILVTAGPGRIRRVSSAYVTQNVVADLLDILVPGRRPEDYQKLECAAARFDIKQGIATSTDGMVLRFKRMDILGSGAMNLRTQEILLGFRAVRRQIWSVSLLGIASDFAQVSGTIRNPRVGLDTEGLLLKGGTAWATFGISLLATDFLRKLQASDDPCARIASGASTGTLPLDALLQAIRPTAVKP